MKMRIKRLAAKRRRDTRTIAKLESSSDSVIEKIIETSMGRVNNPSACVTKAVNEETREEEIALHDATIGQTWEEEPAPEWDGEGGGGEWDGEQTASAAWYERDDGESEEDWEEGDDEEVDDHGGGEDGW